METYEIEKDLKVLLIGLCLLFLAGCGEEKVKKTEYDALKTEFSEYRAAVDAANQLGVKHQVDLNQALADLSRVSNLTMDLRNKLENGTARVSQSQQIKSHIKAIEKKMDALEKEAGKNEALKRNIEQLRDIIKEKQLEIEDLHRQIELQNLTIDTLQRNNEQYLRTIEEQNRKLEASLNLISKQHTRLLESLYNAAHEIELLAVQMPKVSLPRNKKRIKEYQIKVGTLALQYYKIAADMGHEPSIKKTKAVADYLNKLKND